MKQLGFLEQELKMILENIERVKEFQFERKKEKYVQQNSHVVGELKHRLIALKQRINLVSSIVTYDLFKK